MISKVGGNSLPLPTVSNSTGSANLSSNAAKSLQPLLNQLPQKEQMEMLLQMEELIKGSDINADNAGRILKMLSEVSESLGGGTGLFVDGKA